MSEFYPEVPIQEPEFTSSPDDTMVTYTKEHGHSKAITLRTLGYGPFGDQDTYFSPDFRRRYYLTAERLREQFDRIVTSYSPQNRDSDSREDFDNFLLDVRWFLKNRDDVHKVQQGVN